MSAAPADPKVRYALRFAHAAQHLVDVTVRFVGAAAGPGELFFTLPVWTPGSYMVREYARHMEGVCATDGQGGALACAKVRKDRWRVTAAAAGHVCLTYRVYCRELSVRTNYVDAAWALLQGAATFLGHAATQKAPHEVTVHLPSTWATASCGLVGERDGQAVRFVAEDYDALIDSPLLLGSPKVTSFAVSGVDHALVSQGGRGVFDDAEATSGLRQVVAEVHGFWRQVPYARYAFLNVLQGGGGGLEHRHSAVVMAAPQALRRPAQRADYWGLMAHELFHAWNIKRLRPEALGPFAYHEENPTHSLWVAEGLTAYYDDLLVRRCGLTDDAAYLGRLAHTLQALAITPGQGHHALTEASFDAWIKLYRRDENTDNTTVSYYLKGSLVGFVLDARLRAASGGTRSLDDVMRLAYQRYSGERGYTEAEFRQVVGEISGRDESRFLAELLDVPGPVPLEEALDTYGLELQWRGTIPAGQRSLGLWGVSCEDQGGRLVVTRVRRDTAPYAAGLNVGDELIALGPHRLAPTKSWHEAVVDLADGAEAELLVARMGQLQRLAVTLTPEPKELASLTFAQGPSGAQRALREGWLASSQVGGG